MHTTRKLLVAGLVALALVSLPTGTVAADGLAPTSVADVGGNAVQVADLGAVGPSGGATLAATDDVTTDCHIYFRWSEECAHEEETV